MAAVVVGVLIVLTALKVALALVIAILIVDGGA